MWRILRRNRRELPAPPRFAICNYYDGDEVCGPWRDPPITRFDSIEDAVDEAVAMLYDDPESWRELTVWEVHPSGNMTMHHKTVTFGPDANWDTIVVVLEPGEHVRAPGPIPRQITEADLDGYELGDPKRMSLEQDIGRWI